MKRRRLLGFTLITLILLSIMGFFNYHVGQFLIATYNWNPIFAYALFFICCTGIVSLAALLYWCFKEQ